MLKVTNITNIKPKTLGTLFVEAFASEEELRILAFNNIWYEVQ